MSLLLELAASFRQSLLVAERASALRMLEAFTVIYGRLRTDLDGLLEALPDEPGLAQLYQEQRYRLLLEQTEREMRRFAAQAGQEISALQGIAVDAATEQSAQLILAGLGPAPQSAITQVSATMLTRLNRGAVQELVGFLSDGSPLSTLLDRYGPEARQAVERALIQGFGAGLSPRETARLFRKAASTTLGDALRVSRTETLRAYRETTHQSYQANRTVLEGWVWHSSLGPRTCLSCLSMHGSFHPLSARLDDHPNGRCTPIPRTKSWEALGFTEIPDNRPTIERGPDWFAKQSPAFQLRAMGPANYQAYQSGQVALEDFVGRKYSSRWGSHRYERSLISIVGAREQRRLIDQAAD